MMFMHTVPFSIGGMGILVFGAAVAIGAFYLIRRLAGVSSRRRLSKSEKSQEGHNGGNGRTLTDSAIYRLAKSKGGRLTVSDVVIATGASLLDSERALDRIADGVHVTVEVTDRGSVVYEFQELAGPSASPGSDPAGNDRSST